MTFTRALIAKQKIRVLRSAVTKIGYETGYYGLPECPAYIAKQVRLIAHNLYGQHMPLATLQTEVERMEVRVTEAVATAHATRAQVELQPALVPTLRWGKVVAVFAITYLMGELLQLAVREISAREWVTLYVATALITTPWVLKIPVVTGCLARRAAWSAATKVRQLRRQLMDKQRHLEQAVAQVARTEQWITQHVDALQEDYKVAVEPSKKARELIAQLDSVPPPTIEINNPSTPGPESPSPHLNGTVQPSTFTHETALN